MKIYSPIYNYNIANVSFSRRYISYREKQEQIAKIKSAIDVLEQMHDEKPTYSKISGMTGLNCYIISSHLKDPKNHELYEQYMKLKDNGTIAQELQLIEDAMIKLSKIPGAQRNVANLSKLSGLSVTAINNRLYTKSGSELLDKWKGIKDGQNSERLPQFENSDYYLMKKNQMRKKAFKMLSDALSSQTPIRYSTIQKETGLSKEDIEKLIEDYPKTVQKVKEQERQNKELQAQWYKEHYNNLSAQGNRTDFMTFCDEVDKVEDAIKQLIQDGEIVSTSNISRLTGLSRRKIYARIYSSMGEKQGVKELYTNARENNEIINSNIAEVI